MGGGGGRGRKRKAGQQLQKSKEDEKRCPGCKKIGHTEPDCWFTHPEKAPAWWKPQANTQRHANATTHQPEQLRQLQIADRAHTEFSQAPQDQRTYLTGANTVYRAQQSDNASENFKAYRARITGKIAKQEHLVIIRDWILDSGASHHFCADISQFVDGSLKYIKEDIRIANGDSVKSEGRGKVRLVMNKSAKSSSILIINAIYAPALEVNLLSPNALDLDHGLRVNLDVSPKPSQILKGETLVGSLIRYNNLYLVDLTDTNTIALLLRAAVASKKPISLWHRRLGHLGLDSVRKLRDLAIGIEFDKTAERHKNLVERPKNQVPKRSKTCQACVRGKQRKRPLNTRGRNPYRHSTKPFDLVHSDVCEMPEGYDGSRYFITFTDDYTRTTFVKRLQTKDEAFQAFKDFYAFIRTQFGVTIRRIRSDNGGEYASKKFQDEMTKEGMKWEPTVAYNPHENGVAERINQILVNKVICILADSDLPQSLWPELIDTAAYLKNRSPTKHLKGKTPHEALHGVKPNLSHLKIIGCPCWALIPREKRDKLDFKSKECRLLGYEASTQFILYDVEDKRVIWSRDVQFDELAQGLCDAEAVQLFRNKINEIQQIEQGSENSGDETSDESSSPSRSRSQSPFSPFKLPEPEEEPNELLDFFRANIPDQTTFSSFGRRLMPSKRLREAKAGAWHAKIVNPRDPETYQEAVQSPDAIQWQAAMEDQVDSLMENNTWILVKRSDVPKNHRILTGKWVYTRKRKPVKFKARWVVKGFRQRYGVDYFETYAAVAKPMSYKIILALAAHYGLVVHQLDIKSAFLNAELNDEIYMECIEGFKDSGEDDDLVCRLLKSLYGLKQSPRIWAKTLRTFLEGFDLVRLESDHCIFINRNTGIIVAVYVDDLLLVGPTAESLQDLKDKLKDRFKMTSMGLAEDYLGIEISQQPGKITLTQSAFILEILERFGMKDSKPVPTPMESGAQLDLDVAGEPLNNEEKERYQQGVGSLIYLMLGTRPDIAFAVGILSRFTAYPRTKHAKALNRVFRYLNGTIHIGFTYSHSPSKSPIPFGYSDSDYGGTVVKEGRKSTSGYIFFVAGGPVSWSCKRQSVVATSSTEAEYIAQYNASREAIWIRTFLQELGYGFGNLTDQPTVIYADNNGARSLSNDPSIHSRVKHMEIKYYWQRQQVERGFLQFNYIPSEENGADGFTKPKDPTLFKYFRDRLIHLTTNISAQNSRDNSD